LVSLGMWFMLFRPYLAADVVAESTRRLMVVIVLNAMFSFMPGISWQAHLGGALGGFAAAGLLNTMRFGNRRRRTAALALLILLAIGCIGGLLAAMRWSEQWAGYRQLAADERKRQAAKAAIEQFDREVAPLLKQLHVTEYLHPNARVHVVTFHLVWFEFDVALFETNYVQFETNPDELKAIYQLARPAARRNAARVAELRARFTELKGIADAAAAHLEDPPAGVELIDRHREQAKEFAEMRSRSYALLLAMLDSPAIPNEAAWSAWLETSRAADMLWMQIAKR
jgi:rhomboid protease GluP